MIVANRSDRKSVSETIAVTFLILVLAACGPKHEKSSAVDSGNSGQQTSPSDFATIQTQVFAAGQCLNCHNSNLARGGVDLSSYASVIGKAGLVAPGNADGSELYEVLESGEMPPTGKLNDSLIQKVENWINQGANP